MIQRFEKEQLPENQITKKRNMELVNKYFPNLDPTQRSRFEQLGPLYEDWNQKINLISRKDIEFLYDHHILHSLAIAKVVAFKPGAEVLDIGTGGGFPGIPLAILFPETHFTLIDGTGKKIMVVQDIADRLQLTNVTARHVRAEELKGARFDFVVSRAVAELAQLAMWGLRLIKDKQQHALPNGLIALKGGNVKQEIQGLPRGAYAEMQPLSDFFQESYYEEKFAVYVQA